MAQASARRGVVSGVLQHITSLLHIMYVADRSISGYLHVSLWSVYRSRLVSHGSPVVKSEEPEVYTVYINNREQITIPQTTVKNET